MDLVLLPLDERPVNVDLPVSIAAIAGAHVIVPPPDLLPRQRRPGDTAGLETWLLETAARPEVGSVIVSVEMLVFGGLIASRLSTEPVDALVARCSALRRLQRARPGVQISAASLIMRASDSYVADEEPDYWSLYGRELHRLGGALHREHHDAPPAAELSALVADLPAPVLTDFLTRRLRNHTLNLAALSLAHEGVLDRLLLAADDTAVFSAGSIEQQWLRYWTDSTPSRSEVLVHPGADEVGAVLVAAAVSRQAGVSVRVAVACADGDGLERIAPFENHPVRDSIAHQICAVGARLVDNAPGTEPADVLLVVHAPAIEGGDWVRGQPQRPDPLPARLTASLVQQALSDGKQVAVADLRFANGGDPLLIETLIADGTAHRLLAYAGWNTASNSLGSVLATAVAAVVGARTGNLDEASRKRLLDHRLIEDCGYQALTRTSLTAHLPDYVTAVAEQLQEFANLLAPSGRAWSVHDVRLPWQRTFEVDFSLTPPA